MTVQATQAEKAERFRALHEQTCFVIPNPWDIGSARLLEGIGLEALATTSSGFAQTLSRLEARVTLDEKLAHCRLLSAATTVAVSADLENGFADTPEAVADTIRRAADTGVVGGSIEDWSGQRIYPFQLAVEWIQAAVEASRALDFPFTLTARAENLLHGLGDFEDTVRRLQAFASRVILRAERELLGAGSLTWLDGLASRRDLETFLG